ncbi:PLP-dependent cysteine synthase family protein [Candidatus Xianfuyuplasma coldseepsis]|uniref:Pyridoxal-phosphate dependent enzyme n=1 Tax=Candidatus Xianfuyuplasma coldseepsis TaxID=2782163 RepID=A0A7L7KRH2_9MOLU|nr:pyridoxal-phosphate dependent enzyme [Xianfuyuplasma coldseepsis]QMS84398.1 pyridoxal-phosphate dependent enzyme [Xianfuyuplasma coldseepsis]
MSKIPFGPTYEEMLHPSKVDPAIRQQALQAKQQELDPMNLFNITWRNEDNQIHKIVLPKELTGVEANIVVLLGKYFPSGSHKVGPAYSTLIEGCVDQTIVPGEHTILGPSTGNFGIGVAYITNLMGYDSIVIMPDNMSKERYERIEKYGATLDLTPGTESDVILTLERTFELKKDPKNASLAQFELLPNYRFHRHVTGNSCIEAVKDIGNGRIAAFTSAVGSAGTIAAGDQIKQAFPEAKVIALEPYECSTLTNGGRGQHRIEGIGDKMCTLIHNVLNTDFVALIKDDDTIKGLKIIHDGIDILQEQGITKEQALVLQESFGPSGLCNIIGAIKMAKYLRLGPEDNVVTIATDGFDRYNSVLEDLERRYLETEDFVLRRWFNDIFRKIGEEDVFDFRSPQKKEQLFHQKEKDWLKFGYSKAYLDSMKDQSFWDQEYEKIKHYNELIKKLREKS